MAQEAVKKGERTRILLEILLSEIGMDFENTGDEVFAKLQQVHEEYQEAIKNLAVLMKNTHLKVVGVS